MTALPFASVRTASCDELPNMVIFTFGIGSPFVAKTETVKESTEHCDFKDIQWTKRKRIII